MKLQVVWSPEAIEDVESIFEFVARDSKAYAQSIVNKIFEAAKKTSDYPHSGRIVPEFNDVSIREKFVFSYRLIYKISQDTVLIVTIVHDKRLLNTE